MKHLCIKEGLGMLFDVVDKGMDKVLWLATPRADEYPIPTIDLPKNLLLRCKLLRIFPFQFV
jgi:hypothetical protein